LKNWLNEIRKIGKIEFKKTGEKTGEKIN